MISSLPRTVILSPDIVGPVRNGGIGTFVYHFTRLLREREYPVTLVFTGPEEVPRDQWQTMYDDLGVEVIHAYELPPSPQSGGNYPFVHSSSVAARHLPRDADVVYTQDWLAHGFYSLRARRYKAKAYPVFVNVLHSSTHWLQAGMELFPDDAEEYLSTDFGERYVTQHSDFVVSPSAYMRDWVDEQGWSLPSADRVRVLGYPFMPGEPSVAPASAPLRFKRLVFFGRLETRKGIELFIDALRILKHERSAVLQGIEEIVLLGKPGIHRYGSPEAIQAMLQTELNIPTYLLTDLDTYTAQAYLVAHTADSLVVLPSLVDNLPFAVIEASLIPGLNLICSANGGMPEILGVSGEQQCFMPYPRPLADKLTEWLARGPLPDAQRGHYDWKARNQDWLDFHEEVCAHAQRVKHSAPVLSIPLQRPLVDICIPYFNHDQYLPQTLAALEHQTVQHFNVYVINDASTRPEANTVFETMAARYAERGWHFITQPENLGLSHTRNLAAAQGSADYLLFVDSDNVPTPNMVDRLTEAITRSGDDCLTCYLSAFEGTAPPYTLGAEMTNESARILYTYMPVGNCPELGLFVNCFGDANFIIRREVFHTLGGFDSTPAHYRYITGEDHAFLARLALSGYRLDVLPEHLLFYRYSSSSLFRTTSHYQNVDRVQAVYLEHLRTAGLGGLSPLLYGQYLRAQGMSGNFSYTDSHWISTRIPWYILRDAFVMKIIKNCRKLPFFRSLLR